MNAMKTKKEKVVFTNGIYDVLHEGHFTLLQFARSLGDKLVVVINSDESTRKLKGEGRPVNPEKVRKATLEALPYVDEVIIFNELRTKEVIQLIGPDIVVKGGEWTPEKVREIDEIPSNIEV